ncbi:phosphatidylinositol mannoside acyltransferase [Candidatus Poriferisodalis sp.]|uniref:phosphatidylinositol mannoside acyltransferase n=1 Tax=Candidatus Poriferisodalis sp. TaxID=3101277 RepID=UPI003AF9BBE8
MLGYQAGATAARMVPLWLGERLAVLAGPVLARLMPAKADMVRRHQTRAQRWIAAGAGAGGSAGADADGGELDAGADADAGDAGADAMAAERAVQQATAAAFSSYARYWLESFRLPALSESTLDSGIDVPAYHHVEEALERGNGVILALPHLGGWEWAGFWMATVNRLPISVVVEPLHPPELFEWFANFRERLGMRVVPLGPDAGREVLGALRRNEIVCLLCDRDLTSDGIEVSFGDEQTTLPAGPALLALRSGAALLPTAVYFRPRGKHLGTVRPPVDVTRRGRLRDDVAAVTQRLADELVTLIAAEPRQWHLFGPNWPSDRPAVSGDAADGD